ncbi:hypothetical protein F5Y18DRAFT_9354 [Xylariaceae sp. FL1019]|nr:hypothetical protein F5Y18DRAFT_9354 [Xylariaceae sp. FL1019]
MSGIEVAGLVLGAIPLLIAALEHFQDGKSAVSTWRRHVRVVQSLTRNLRTEHGKMYNTCETLLGGIIAPVKIEPMLEQPFGPLWHDKDISARIERRLDHMYNAFEETVQDMLCIIEELKRNLGLHAEGQSDTSMGGAVKRNMMRASLVVKRSSYEDALQRLITQNQTLETIVIGSLRLEPSRQRRSRGKYLELFQRVLSSIYKAIHLGLCEHGPIEHKLSLQLLSPQSSVRGDEENAINKVAFRVILSHHAPNCGDVDAWPQTWKWREVSLRVDDPPMPPTMSLAHHTRSPIEEGLRKSKRVKFSDSSTNFSIVHASQRDKVDTVDTVHPALFTLPPNPASRKLCQSLSMGVPGPMVCEYIDDPSVQTLGRFGVSSVNENCDNCDLSFISIREMMEAPPYQRHLNAPSLPEKLSIASAIASAVLQLYSTPWLSRSMTSHTLHFAQLDGVARFSQVYISNTEKDCRHEPRCSGPCDVSGNAIDEKGNDLMWALFVLLTEVILWNTIDNILSSKPSSNLPSQVFDYTTEEGYRRVRDILSKVAMASGQEYCSAVECCLKLAYGYPRLDLQQEGLRQQIFAGIATPIEASWENSTTLTIMLNGFGFNY